MVAYLLAPLPNRIAFGYSQSRSYFNDGPNKGTLELGYFFTSCLIVSGLGLPCVLNHAGIITDHSMYLSLIGGSLIYITILGYMYFFLENSEDGFP